MILTDSEEIASYAFASLRQYLEIYEAQPSSRVDIVPLVSPSLISRRLDCARVRHFVALLALTMCFVSFDRVRSETS